MAKEEQVLYIIRLLRQSITRYSYVYYYVWQIKQLEKLLSIEEESQKSDAKPEQTMVCPNYTT